MKILDSIDNTFARLTKKILKPFISHKLFSYVFSLMVIVFCSPTFMLIALLLKIESNEPVFVRHVIGLNKRGKTIIGLKFRKEFRRNKKQYSTAQSTSKLGKVFDKSGICDLPLFISVVLGDATLAEINNLGTPSAPTAVRFERPKTKKFKNYLHSLKYLLPRRQRVELSELYWQTKGDLKDMKLDMQSKNFSTYWINFILIVNVLSVIISTTIYKLKKILICFLIKN